MYCAAPYWVAVVHEVGVWGAVVLPRRPETPIHQPDSFSGEDGVWGASGVESMLEELLPAEEYEPIGTR